MVFFAEAGFCLDRAVQAVTTAGFHFFLLKENSD